MKYRHLKGYKYELLATVAVNTEITGGNVYIPPDNTNNPYVNLWPGGRLFVFRHYCWDGPSFLTIDTKNSMRGSLVHDALYQLMREGLLDRKWRKAADKLLRDICIADGMNPARAKLWYRFVRWFAKKSSMPRKKPRGKIIEISEPLAGKR